MSCGRRKSRKPQKLDDFVADERELQSLEKALEREEAARMQSSGEESEQDSDSSSEEIQEVSKGETIIKGDKSQSPTTKLDQDLNLKTDELVNKEGTMMKTKNDTDKLDLGSKYSDKMKIQQSQKNMDFKELIYSGFVGECSACSIQLRDWPSTHEHLRFHRLVHIPECINYLITPSSRSQVKCQICQRSCQTKEVLAYHAYTEHPMSERSAHKCPFCGETFSTLSDYQDHIDISAITFHCQTCKKSLKSEHKFYSHLSKCLVDRQPKVSSVTCPICKISNINISQLSSHLSEHSTLLRDVTKKGATHNRSSSSSTLAPTDTVQSSDERNDSYRPFLCEMCDRRFVLYTEYKRHMFTHQKSKCYVCTHCGKSYCQKNSLIVHLYTYHKAAPNSRENTPVEDISQKYCELCNDSGFETDDLLHRHAILRCSKRDNAQISFAVIINSISKNLNLSFRETMEYQSLTPYMKLGFESWSKVPKVKRFLDSVSSARISGSQKTLNNTNNISNRKDVAEFTDVQLLEWLSEFEDKNRHQDKELDLLIKMKSKNADVMESEAISVIAVPSNQNNSRVNRNKDFGPPSPVPANVSILPADPTQFGTSMTPYKFSKTEEQVLPDFSRLMSHLQNTSNNSTNYNNVIKIDDNAEGSATLDICLVTSTTNTQVSITPAGNAVPTDGRNLPTKVAHSLPHKPSIEYIQKHYPGVQILRNVDFSRIPRLLMEIRQMTDNSIENEMYAAGITPQRIERLHAEAQYLRELEPFYVVQDRHWKEKQDDMEENRKSKKRKLEHLDIESSEKNHDPSLLEALRQEAQNYKNTVPEHVENPLIQTLTPEAFVRDIGQIPPSEQDYHRLMREARSLC